MMSGHCETCEHWTREPPEIPGQPPDSYPWGNCRDPTAPHARFEVFNWVRTHHHHSCPSWAPAEVECRLAGGA